MGQDARAQVVLTVAIIFWARRSRSRLDATATRWRRSESTTSGVQQLNDARHAGGRQAARARAQDARRAHHRRRAQPRHRHDDDQGAGRHRQLVHVADAAALLLGAGRRRLRRASSPTPRSSTATSTRAPLAPRDHAAHRPLLDDLTGGCTSSSAARPRAPRARARRSRSRISPRASALQCVVFNCSDQLDYKMMGKLFSGVAQTGCWTCLDEFNRIDIEVLSVVAQQLLTIRQALLRRLERFVFEGREIALKPTCGVFITMNPGYAGRTELPDNLKALFRPVSMMVPDYALIGEIMLYAEGFLERASARARRWRSCTSSARSSSRKQDHYDYGMRAGQVGARDGGRAQARNPELHENISLIRAMREANMPTLPRRRPAALPRHHRRPLPQPRHPARRLRRSCSRPSRTRSCALGCRWSTAFVVKSDRALPDDATCASA